FQGLVTTYGASALSHHAVTPFEPAAKAVPALGKTPSLDMANAIRYCWYTIKQPEFLDGDFLRDQLPGLVKSAQCPRADIAHYYLQGLLELDLDRDQCEADKEQCMQRRQAIQSALGLLAKAGLKDVLGDLPQAQTELQTWGCPTPESFTRQI